MAKKIFVLDTNVLISDPKAIFNFDEHDIVVPIVVIEATLSSRWYFETQRLMSKPPLECAMTLILDAPESASISSILPARKSALCSITALQSWPLKYILQPDCSNALGILPQYLSHLSSLLLIP